MGTKQIIKETVRDFYGQYSPNEKTIWNYLIKRKHKPKLTEEQNEDLWHIKVNLEDPIYRQSIVQTLKKKQFSCSLNGAN